MGGLALVIMVFMSLGVIIGVVRPRQIFWFVVLLMIFPFVTGTAQQAFNSVFSRQNSLTTWIIGILVILLAIRFATSRFRGH